MNILSALLTIVVGISCSGMKDSTKIFYNKCLQDAGAEMIIFDEYATSDSLAQELVAKIDALIVPGKTAKDTAKRFNYDKRMIKYALEAGKPVLGICLGHQHLNNYFKGKTKKNVDINPDAMEHRRVEDGYNVLINKKAHKMIVEKDSELYKMMGKKRKVKINSSHNFSVSKVGEGLRVTAVAPDGIVEAIEGENCLGVQFHPEFLYGKLGYKKFLPIFQWLVNKAAANKDARTGTADTDGCCQ